MIANVIVVLSVLLSVAFVVAWLALPACARGSSGRSIVSRSTCNGMIGSAAARLT